MEFLLWPIFAVWIGLGLLVGLLIVGMLGWCTAHLVWDVVVGAKGQIWCPAMQRRLRVSGVPRGTLIGAPFVSLRRCERYGSHPIGCDRNCLRYVGAQMA